MTTIISLERNPIIGKRKVYMRWRFVRFVTIKQVNGMKFMILALRYFTGPPFFFFVFVWLEEQRVLLSVLALALGIPRPPNAHPNSYDLFCSWTKLETGPGHTFPSLEQVQLTTRPLDHGLINTLSTQKAGICESTRAVEVPEFRRGRHLYDCNT